MLQVVICTVGALGLPHMYTKASQLAIHYVCMLWGEILPRIINGRHVHTVQDHEM
jgi:hypothetical protein